MDGAPGTQASRRTIPGLKSETWGTRYLVEDLKGNRGSFDSLRSLKMTVVGVGLRFPTHAVRCANVMDGAPRLGG